jgi:hypothetical protein
MKRIGLIFDAMFRVKSNISVQNSISPNLVFISSGSWINDFEEVVKLTF